MYNGIGLTTARGSGTNGYVQRNLSCLTVNKNHKTYDEVDREAAIFEQRLGRAPNKALLNHEKKRKIEIKCIELADLMLEQGYDEDEIKRKVASYREILKEKDPSISKVGRTDDESGKTLAESSHEIAKLNEAQQQKLKNAFGIRDGYKPGSAFTNGLGGAAFSGAPGAVPGAAGSHNPPGKATFTAPNGVPSHMLNEKPEKQEGFKSKYDGLESEDSYSSSSDSSSSSSSSSDDEKERRAAKKRKSKARKSKIREDERKRKLRKRRLDKENKQELEVKEEAQSLRATPIREQPVLPLHKKRRERGRERESEGRTFSENGRTDRPADFPNYAEFARPNLPQSGYADRNQQNRQNQNQNQSGSRYDNRAQYRDMYSRDIDYENHDNRLSELNDNYHEQRRQYRDSRDQRGYDDKVVNYKTSEDGYHSYNQRQGGESGDRENYGRDGYGRGAEDEYYDQRNSKNHSHRSDRGDYGYR